MQRDNFFNDRKSETVAIVVSVPGFIYFIKSLEYGVELFRGHPDSIIDDGDGYFCCTTNYTDANIPAFRCEFDAVAEQIHPYLLPADLHHP